MSVGWEKWSNSKRYTMMCHFHKNNLTWREALYETVKDIRARTNKTLVLPISGGSDSMLLYHVLKDLNIEVKTIHQRYWTKDPFPLMEGFKTPGLINEYESRHVDPEIIDVYQDIDVNDFQKTEWFKKRYIDYCPMPWFAGLVPYLTVALDQENDFILFAADFIGYGVSFNEEDNTVDFNIRMGDNMEYTIGLDGYEYSAVLSDNATITYCRFRNTPKDILCREKIDRFEYFFPEIDHLPKFHQREWPVFIDLLNKRSDYRNEWVAHQTYFDPTGDLDFFNHCVDDGYPLISSRDWYNPLNLKVFSDKTEYHTSTTIPSKNL
jgi:hypothetical protein